MKDVLPTLNMEKGKLLGNTFPTMAFLGELKRSS
jgi:hypothetical protein